MQPKSWRARALRQLTRADWRDPLRMTIAAALALSVPKYLGLREAFWAVLSALVITRPHVGGTLHAGAGRLAGTVCGAGLAALVVIGRHWHLPELVLLMCIMIPLGFLIAFKPEYRAAPVAAIIVLSSSSLGHSPLHAAGLRIVGIAVGAAIGSLVSAFVFPTATARHDVFVKRVTRLTSDGLFAIRMLRHQVGVPSLREHAHGVAAELQQLMLRKADELAAQVQVAADEAAQGHESGASAEARAMAQIATQRYVLQMLKRDLRSLDTG